MKYKAAIFTAPNAPLVVDYIENDPLKENQVLVKVLRSGICGAQQNEINGHKFPNLVPRTLGHEGVGIVVEVGPGVKKVKPDDLVCLHWRKSEGSDSDYPYFSWNGSRHSTGLITTLSEYSVVSVNRLTKVKVTTDFDLAALMGCCLSTALSTVNKTADIKFGDSVLIVGAAGGVGLSLVLACNMVGATVIGCDIKTNASLVASLGGVLVKDIDSKFDVIISTVGSQSVISHFFPKLAESGRFILVGQPKPGEDIVLPNAIKMFGGDGQKFICSEGGGFSPDYDLSRYIQSVVTEPWRNIITHRFKLDRVNEAFDSMKLDSCGRVIIDL